MPSKPPRPIGGMTPEQEKAHKKLLEKLPIHNHDSPIGEKQSRTPIRACVVRGRRFSSIVEAAKGMKVSRATIYRWLREDFDPTWGKETP